ncbi:MAG: sugar phosphate isomerase/epimerase [Planctomycetaceae bacterium]|jgi:sugar phosphate isomerase/epimerase|nr:sugar phosphate isomerase/epimerase [Planctomycetaceae bacterium]
MERRLFLKAAAVSTLGVVSFSSHSVVALAAAKKKRIPISVQVYSVRKAAEKDLAAALKKIAEIGYEGVEFAGYYGKDAKEVRKFLDDAGLKCSGTHTGIGALRGDNFNKTVELHKTLGTRFIIVPGGINNELHSVEGNKKIAEEFNKLAEKAKAVGMVIGYHAHGGDAKLIEGIPAWERFFDATTPDVLMEMDLGNYLAVGGDPYKMIEKFKGRSKAVHLKESGDAIIGSGKIDWKRTFELCETIGGTEWYVVEDEKDADSFERIGLCYDALKKMGKTKESATKQGDNSERRQRFGRLRQLLRG